MDNTRLDRRRRSDTDAEFSRATPARGPVKKRAAIRSHLTHEEKLARAAATEGLSKGDKRRVQNKLAQRAFRARNKNSSNSVGDPYTLVSLANDTGWKQSRSIGRTLSSSIRTAFSHDRVGH